MARIVRNCFLVLIYAFISIHVDIALAQGNAAFDNARQLNKQEILDLISDKAITYRVTVGSMSANTSSIVMNKVTFKKTEEFGGNLIAYISARSSEGKWYVNDKSRLVRQYEKVSWGNKPFSVGVFENDGKYYWKIGEEFQELVSIE